MEAKLSKGNGRNEKSNFYKQLDQDVKEYDANKELHDMAERQAVTDHKHYFTMVAGNAIECSCGWGLFTDVDDELRDGHLFRKNKKII